RTRTEISAVRDQAEASKERGQIPVRPAQPAHASEDEQRNHASPDRPAPGDEEGIRIGPDIRARDVERMEHDLLDRAAAEPGVQDVAALVDGHHGQPREEDGGDDEEDLEEARHGTPSKKCLADRNTLLYSSENRSTSRGEQL